MTITTFITLNAVLAATVGYAIVLLLGAAIRSDRVAPATSADAPQLEVDRIAA